MISTILTILFWILIFKMGVDIQKMKSEGVSTSKIIAYVPGRIVANIVLGVQILFSILSETYSSIKELVTNKDGKTTDKNKNHTDTPSE